MNKTKLLKDIFTAFSAQGTAFLCSLAMTLIVPKMLGVTEFGYWQLFVFYASYVSFFQFGLNDGVYLRNGGIDRDKIDKSMIKGQLVIGVVYQLVFALVIALYGVYAEDDGNRSFVIVSSAVFLIISNVNYFLAFVFQAMNETKLSSYSVMVDRILFLIPVVFCLVAQIDDFRFYVIFFIIARLISLFYCLFWAKDFLIAPLPGLRESAHEVFQSVRLGLVLTVANVCGMLIIGLVRIVVDLFWGIDSFGEVSFSLSIVNFALAFISQAAMVLFPALRKVSMDELKAVFVKMRDVLGLLTPFSFLLYPPLRILVGAWLPQYLESLSYLTILMPIIVFEIQTNLIVATILKVRNNPRALLLLNLVSLAVGFLLVLFSVFVFEEIFAVLYAGVASVAFRYVLGMLYLSRSFGSSKLKLLVSVLGVSAVFCVLANTLSPGVCLLATAVSLAVFLCINKKEFRAVVGEGLLRKVR